MEQRTHISHKFEEELSLLKKKILTMGEIVSINVEKAIQALLNRDMELAYHIIEEDHFVNDLEVEIDEMCLRMIALRQPAARDLRFITTGFRIINTLERIGDLAVNICKRALDMEKEPRMGVCVHLPKMAEAAQEMVRRSLLAFVEEDVDLALEVCHEDAYVDTTYKEVLAELIQMMGVDKEVIPRAMQVMFVARYTERIADHAVHIAEQVVFMVKGKVIRHAQGTLDFLDDQFHKTRDE
jgi:phosphate transport system protein